VWGWAKQKEKEEEEEERTIEEADGPPTFLARHFLPDNSYSFLTIFFSGQFFFDMKISKYFLDSPTSVKKLA